MRAGNFIKIIFKRFFERFKHRDKKVVIIIINFSKITFLRK